MVPKTFQERFSWAIIRVIDRDKLSNERLAVVMGVSDGAINNYRRMLTEPKVSFIEDFCKKFDFNFNWILIGKGEPFEGAREKYPEVCGPEERQPRELTATITGEQTAYKAAYSVNERHLAVGQLHAIFDSGDPPTIRAIVSNLDVFAHTIEQKKENIELRNKIAVLERRLDRLETESRREGGKNQGDATDDGHDCPIEKKVM